MRSPTRRAALGLGAAASLATGYAWWRARRVGPDETVGLEVAATPIRAIETGRPDGGRIGALTFRSGLVLFSATPGLGGLSGLWRDPGGRRLVAISDHGQWLTADLLHEDGRLAGLSDARLSPILGPDGAPLRRGAAYDCESLAMAGGDAFVGIERTHEVLRFAFGEHGVAARGQRIAIPAEVTRQPRNRGLEALCVAPPSHALAGALVGIAEASASDDDGPIPGWVLTGPERFAFRVAKAPRFNVTDAAFLPSGELLLLERSFSILQGAGCRVRRIARDAIRPDGLLDGEVLMEADGRFEIDNMEGLAVHRDPTGGETVLTLVSDDNFMPFQRTLLLEFALMA